MGRRKWRPHKVDVALPVVFLLLSVTIYRSLVTGAPADTGYLTGAGGFFLIWLGVRRDIFGD